MYYLFKTEGQVGSQTTQRTGRPAKSMPSAIDRLKDLAEGEVRDEHNHLVALKTKTDLHIVADLYGKAPAF